MQRTAGSKRAVRALGVAIVFGSLILGFGTSTSTASEPDGDGPTPTAPATASPSSTTPTPDEGNSAPDTASLPQSHVMAPLAADAPAVEPPYGWDYPVTLESNFSRPYKSISSQANSDFSLLNDLERLIKGSWWDYANGRKKSKSDIKAAYVFLSVSRMENSHRVGRKLIEAAEKGVLVRVIHGKASQSKESRALQKKLNSLKTGSFRICQKGKSLACLASGSGAIMHSKILLVNRTFTRDNVPAHNAIWSGSANLGGPSGERTYNNGLTIYNDKKLWEQSRDLWADMWAERNIGQDYPAYVRSHDGNGRYGYDGATGEGYTKAYAPNGMFYSNLANVTIYPTPIKATPTNGRDPVLNLLNRIEPDKTCQIRLQQNRFKYRRIAVAQKLAELVNGGCSVEIVAFEDDLKVNRIAHCQMYIRVCRPILDVLKTADRRVPAAWAKPHDKTILVEANMRRGAWNDEELLPNGQDWPGNGKTPVFVRVVQAGSAALTGSNLVGSDEITTETTDPNVYEDYMEHWQAITMSREYTPFGY